jgi:hypothetical protein
MLSVIDLKSIVYERTYPYTRNRQGRMIQEPYFTVSDGGETFHLRGRLVMWSFLDSLFRGEPLPRGPVEDDLFAPNIDTPSMLNLFTEFADEASRYNRFLILEHDDTNSVSMAHSLVDYALSSDIERVGSMLESAGFNVDYRPSVYIDRSGSHLRSSAYCAIGEHTLRVVEIGSSYYMSMTAVDSLGKKYALVAPTAVKKNNKYLRETLRNMLDLASVGVARTVLSRLHMAPAVNESPYLLTRELDTLLHDRLRRCI